jgi:hypothetical protein
VRSLSHQATSRAPPSLAVRAPGRIETLLCTGGQGSGQHWLFASPSGGAMTTATGPGLRVAWLP